MSPSGPESGSDDDQGRGGSVSPVASSSAMGRLDELLSTPTRSFDDPDSLNVDNFDGSVENRSEPSDRAGLHRRDLAGLNPQGYPQQLVDNLPIGEIEPNDFQPRSRFDEEALAALAESVRAMGVLQPVLVRPRDGGGYELIAGERRWRAARRAGLETIPAIIRPVGDQRSLEEAIVENLHRADLNPIEEATAFQQLIEEFGLTQDEVAERVGKSRPAVANTLRLTQLPGSVQRMVADGSLSAGHARALLVLDDPIAQRRLADEVVDKGLSVREVEARVKPTGAGTGKGSGLANRGPKARSRDETKSTAALEIERTLGDRFDTRVEVFETLGTGRIVINFADPDDLDRIYQLLTDG